MVTGWGIATSSALTRIGYQLATKRDELTRLGKIWSTRRFTTIPRGELVRGGRSVGMFAFVRSS
jgi:hypothetical protein